MEPGMALRVLLTRSMWAAARCASPVFAMPERGLLLLLLQKLLWSLAWG